MTMRRWSTTATALSVLLAIASRASAIPVLRGSTAALNTNAATDGGEDTVPWLATDSAGTWLAVWRTTNPPGAAFDPNVLFARSTDGGATWTAPATFDSAAGGGGNDSYPRVVVSAAGTWIAAWTTDNTLGGTIGADLDVVFARSTNAGTSWSPTAPLDVNAAVDAGDDGFPHLATDGAGTWVAVWESDDTLGGALGTDQDIFVAHSTDDGVTWSTPAALNANAGSDVGTDAFPRVATDGDGTWIAVWMSTDPLGGPPSADFDVLVARSTDGGVTWSAPVLLAGADAGAGYDGNPTIAVDAAGGWVVAWNGVTDAGTEILITRSSDGGQHWAPPVAISSGQANQWPALATPRAGVWLATWEAFDPIAGDTGIVLATSTNGGGSWSLPVPLSTDASSGVEASIAAEATGAFVTAWYSNAGFGGGTDQDVLVSRGSVLPLDPFRCYAAKTSRGAPKPTLVPGVALVDPAAAEAVTVDLKKPRQLCAPADDGGGLSDPATHLEAYDAKLVKGSAKLVKRIDVHVTSPVGMLRLDTVKPLQLLVPTAKDPLVDPAPPDLAEIAIDHYRCDKVKLTKGAPKFPKGVRITLGDQFTAPGRLLELKKPGVLCTPVEVGAVPRRTPALSYLCFPAKQVKAACTVSAPRNAGGLCKRESDCGGTTGATSFCVKQAKHVTVSALHVANVFAAGRLDARKPELACVPAERTP